MKRVLKFEELTVYWQGAIAPVSSNFDFVSNLHVDLCSPSPHGTVGFITESEYSFNLL